MSFMLPLGVSARHCHLNREAMDVLFGKDSELHSKKPIIQPGQFASEEQITLETAKGKLKLRVLGPLRPYTQVELSFTDARAVGLVPPVRTSGDLADSCGGRLIGPAGTLDIKEGIIVAGRHIHLCPETAEKVGLKNGDIVALRAKGERGMLMENVLVRAGVTNMDEVHIDTDEANACECHDGELEVVC